MTFRSRALSCFWIASLLISGVFSQSCRISQDGEEISIGTELINTKSVSDASAAEVVVERLQIIEGTVTGVSLGEEKYLAATIEGEEIVIRTTNDFQNYEENESASSFEYTLVMDCADESERNINILTLVDLTNNHDPTFIYEEGTSSYNFLLPMPFPKGVAINLALEIKVGAYDVDIFNTDISFELDDPSGNLEITPQDVVVTPGEKNQYLIVIRSAKLLNLQNSYSFKIIAKDNEGAETRTAEATVTITVDQANTTPITFGFKQNFYTAKDDNPTENGPIVPNEPIELIDVLTGDVVVTLAPASGDLPSFESKFEGKYEGNGIVTISQIEAFTESDVIPPSIGLEIQVSEATSGFLAKTVLLISLPVNECPNCPTTCPTCSPSTTCPTFPTCPPCNTPFPTEPSSCPTCAPCTSTTPKPPASIEFEVDSYATTKEPFYTGVLFQVKANVLDGSDSDIEYGVDAKEEMVGRLEMDKVTGELSLTRNAAPGTYKFEVTALHVISTEVARVPAYLAITSVGECSDGTTCFKYALVTTDVIEATEVDDLIPGSAPSGDNCAFRIDDRTPEFDGWFEIDAATGALKALAATNVEDAAFIGVETPQVMLRLRVTCGLTKENKDTVNASLSHRLQEGVTKEEMLVVVNLLNKNEHAPQFASETLTVGYPSKAFARQIFPGSIVQVKATDADKGDEDNIRYSLEFVTEQFTIDEVTGEVFPIDGKFDYQNVEINLLARDNLGEAPYFQGRLKLRIQMVGEGEVAVTVIDGTSIDEAESIIAELNAKLDTHIWGSLRTSYVAGDNDAKVESTALTSSRALGGGLTMVLYALDKNSLTVAPHAVIKQLLQNYNPASGWSISGIDTWQEAGGWSQGNPSADEGLTIAVIVLSVIVALLIIAIIAVVYVVVFRRSKLDKMRAKVGVKNRTSFSKHRESLAVEAAKRTHVNGLDFPHKPEEEMEERKKSTVKFNDEPEVIPSNESVRL
ncbi:uncharacterized protein LOC132200576 [Neocloeon triangulifer]|uniref:uncharacterized protein LOC132200576 n=1 Tax=Neocloeon triangulifer TaxID=2078957 RepID=UPI00286F0FBD|nr:uncharacterized protein LOC132200576 [Neocloeon triangulifer]